MLARKIYLKGAIRTAEAFEFLIENVEYGKLPEHARSAALSALASAVSSFYMTNSCETGKVARQQRYHQGSRNPCGYAYERELCGHSSVCGGCPGDAQCKTSDC